MCGIFGFVAAHSGELNIKNLYDGLELVRHRGPDGEGGVFFASDASSGISLISPDTPKPIDSCPSLPSWFPTEQIEVGGLLRTAKVGLGHRRLSIIDLSPFGHQPMSYKSARYWITYNGEIYNYIELRDELIKLGHHFESHSDTEVILAAYTEWGQDCVRKFNGMWAFAIYDTQERTLLLSRDRFGVKPLYYWISKKGHFFFASEIKQFTAMPEWSAYLNHQRAYDFLAWGVIDHTDETLFKGVYQLPPGHIVTLQADHIDQLKPNDKLLSQQWYVLPSIPNYKGTFAEAVKDIRAALEDSVALRLRADVPVGSCLSGGIDSSSIVCIMDQLLKKIPTKTIQKTFSALASDERLNELKWMKSVIDKVKPEAYFVTPDLGELISLLPRITWHQDEPFGSTSIFAQWKVFELAAEHKVRVMLDGQGADEQLFGYHWAIGVYLGDILKKGKILDVVMEIIAINKILGYGYIKLLVRMMSSFTPIAFQEYFRKFSGYATARPTWIDWSRLEPDISRKYPFSERLTSISGYCHAQMTSSNLQMLLHLEDRDSMAHSIEARVPFLDYRLAELSMSLPDAYKLRKGITKRVLREAMGGIIPDAIRERSDKIGFATPEEKWIREVFPDMFRKKMQQAIENSGGVLNEKCQQYLEGVIQGRKPFNFIVWRMISFGEWMNVFSVKVDK